MVEVPNALLVIDGNFFKKMIPKFVPDVVKLVEFLKTQAPKGEEFIFNTFFMDAPVDSAKKAKLKHLGIQVPDLKNKTVDAECPKCGHFMKRSRQADVDIEIAVTLMEYGNAIYNPKIQYIILVSGDGDFGRVVNRIISAPGMKRLFILVGADGMTSSELRAVAGESFINLKEKNELLGIFDPKGKVQAKEEDSKDSKEDFKEEIQAKDFKPKKDLKSLKKGKAEKKKAKPQSKKDSKQEEGEDEAKPEVEIEAEDYANEFYAKKREKADEEKFQAESKAKEVEVVKQDAKKEELREAAAAKETLKKDGKKFAKVGMDELKTREREKDDAELASILKLIPEIIRLEVIDPDSIVHSLKIETSQTLWDLYIELGTLLPELNGAFQFGKGLRFFSEDDFDKSAKDFFSDFDTITVRKNR